MKGNILEQILEGSMKPTHLPLETLKKITDNFSEDRILGDGGFGIVYKGIVGNMSVAVKRIKSIMTINDKLFHREVNSLMEVNHHNVVKFLGLCSNTVETPMRIPNSSRYIYVETRERLLCFEYISNGSLHTRITDELRGLEWDTRYQIIKGICAGLHYLHMEKHIIHMDLKPANILLDNQMVPKITDFGLSRPMENSQTMTTNHFVSLGYTAPENRFSWGKMTSQSDMYSLGVIIIELVTGHKGIPDDNNISDLITFVELHILRRWRHRWNKSAKEIPPEYQQQVTECIKIGSLCQKEEPFARSCISDIMSRFVEMESMNYHGTNTAEPRVGQINMQTLEDDMLGVEPLELQFGCNKQKQILSCLVELSNDTDGFIVFEIQKLRPLPYSIKPNKDIVKPRSKYSVEITLPLANMQALQYSTGSKGYNEEFIVRSIKVNDGLTINDINEEIFDKLTAGQNIDEIHLTVVCEELCSKAMSSQQDSKFLRDAKETPDYVLPGQENTSVMDIPIPMKGHSKIVSVDVHPVEPWILVTHFEGPFRIWNYQKKEIVMEHEVMREQQGWNFLTAKFIVREQWIVAGGCDYCIHVFHYNTMQKVYSFKALTQQITSLAIHPTKPFVLATSYNFKIGLWDWKNSWESVQKFEKEHSGSVMQIAFDPKDDSSFASVSKDETIKIWSIGSPHSRMTLTWPKVLTSKEPKVRCLDYFTNKDKQYLITGSDDGTAKIWDVQKTDCVETLSGHESGSRISTVCSHPELPLLMTGSWDGTVRLWNSNTFRHERIIEVGRQVHALGCIKGSTRVVIGHSDGLGIVEI